MAQAYTVSPNLLNLNNGGVSPQPKVVQDAVDRYYHLSNEAPTYYMWQILDKGREPLRRKLADLAGVLLMLPKTWRDPLSETLSTFVLAGFSGALGAAAVGALDPALLLYPAYFGLMNAVTAAVILVRRRALAAGPSPAGLHPTGNPTYSPTGWPV